jgi:hypothetical protein
MKATEKGAAKVAAHQEHQGYEEQLTAAALQLAREPGGRAITVNAAQQQQLKAPFTVTVAGDRGEGIFVAFTMNTAGEASDWCWRYERLRDGIEWPARMSVEAADGEIVRGVLHGGSDVKVESRFIPAAQ